MVRNHYEMAECMKEIPLTQGKVALVDDEDFERVNQWKWNAELHKTRAGTESTWYAKRIPWDSVSKRSLPKIYMHRFVVGLSDASVRIDHRDRNGLNNQRSNLRLSTPSQNHANSIMNSRNTSGFRGVHWDKNRLKWEAQIRCGEKRIHLGRFETKAEAAIAYNNAAVAHFGEFATLNQI